MEMESSGRLKIYEYICMYVYEGDSMCVENRYKVNIFYIDFFFEIFQVNWFVYSAVLKDKFGGRKRMFHSFF